MKKPRGSRRGDGATGRRRPRRISSESRADSRRQFAVSGPADLSPVRRANADRQTVGHSMCERLTVIPVRLVVEQHLDETAACLNDGTIVSAVVPLAIVEGGKLADPLIVESTCDKYIEHLPIERQCQRWARLLEEVAVQGGGTYTGCHGAAQPGDGILGDYVYVQVRAT